MIETLARAILFALLIGPFIYAAFITAPIMGIAMVITLGFRAVVAKRYWWV